MVKPIALASSQFRARAGHVGLWILACTVSFGVTHYLVRQENYADCLSYRARTGLDTELVAAHNACVEEAKPSAASFAVMVVLAAVFTRGLRARK